MEKTLKPATLCVQAGWKAENGAPRVLPIYQSTTFKYDNTEEMADLFDLKKDGYFYTRLQNPTNDAVASKIAALEGGVGAVLTSSGQARAIAPKPKILMLDEATSALDNITQKHVSDSLEKLKCTRIVIAHRLSTIRHCDRIIVLDEGRIVEDGKYDELIALGGMFAELVERQRIDK